MSETKLDRRGFLAGAAGLTGVALSVGAWKPVFAMESGPLAQVATAVKGGPGSSTFKVGAIGLSLGETSAGHLFSAEGGHATSDVVNEKVGPDLIVRKHIAGVKYEDITVSCGTGMSKGFYNWIKDSFSLQPRPQNGSIAGADFNFKIFETTTFTNAVITEFGMPALDAASKDAAKMTLKFRPEITAVKIGAAGMLSQAAAPQKKWLVSNFKLTMNGMNTSAVSKIDAINWKWDINTGNDEGFFFQLRSINFPNMKFTIPEAQAQDFIKWHEDFVIKGNNSVENQKTGSLSFLSTDLKTELFRLDLSGIGIFALDADPLAVTPTSAVRHMTAQVFVEKMGFNFKL